MSSLSLSYCNPPSRENVESVLSVVVTLPDLSSKSLRDSSMSSERRSCVKVEVAVLGSPSLIVLVVCVDVKQH